MKYPLLNKALAVGLIGLMLWLLLARIGFLVDERSARQDEAVRGVQQSHAGEQSLLGPLLQRHCTESWEEKDEANHSPRSERRAFTLLATPSHLAVEGDVSAEARYRGLFKVNSYGTRLTLLADWQNAAAALSPVREHPGSRLSCQAPTVLLALGDVRGVRSASVWVQGAGATAATAGTELRVLPGTNHTVYAQGLHAELLPEQLKLGVEGAEPALNTPLNLKLNLELAGTARLALVPVAQATSWQLRADWPHPSFGGRFLPSTREVRADGFSASWNVSALASAAPAAVLKGQPLCALPLRALAYAPEGEASTALPDNCLDTLSVAFIDPINPYVLSDRAIKYGMLFISLTFVAVALAEVLGRERLRRVHPIQYALVGLALTLFFLLLLSLSEHLPFVWAYGLASSACVLVLGFYASHMLGRARAGLGFAAAMAGLYALVYLLLQSEQMALVMGSVGLFVALGVVMWLTRKVDWYRLFASSALPDAGSSAEQQLHSR
jgi:inner membrane protein